MAGMLPGVELARRRRTNHQNHFHLHHHLHHQSFDSSNSRDPSLHKHLESSSSMDATALMARRRLEEKLRGSSAPSRRSKQQSTKGEKTFNHVAFVKENQTSATKQVKQSLQLNRVNSQRELCAICLEDFQAHQQVMNLPCCHRYHSNCLLPWLATHSHCPYCRTHVISSSTNN